MLMIIYICLTTVSSYRQNKRLPRIVSQKLITETLHLPIIVKGRLLKDSLQNVDLDKSSKYHPPEIITANGYIVLSLCFLVILLCALDRVAISVAIIPMSLELGYSESTKGIISSVFSLGYMVGLVPSGLLGTFTSPKVVMALGVALWSLAQMLSPTAAYVSIPVLLGCRFAMGVAESVAVPTVQSFVARWTPEAQRSLVLAVILAGGQIGNTIAYLVSPTLLDKVAWQGLFVAYGSLGFLWLLLWLPFATDNPTSATVPTDATAQLVIASEVETNAEAHLFVTENCSATARTTDDILASDTSTVAVTCVLVEDAVDTTPTQVSRQSLGTDSEGQSLASSIATIAGPEPADRSGESGIPWGAFIKSGPVQAICVAHSVQNFGMYIITSWLPTYFNQRFHLSVEASSLLAVLPWITGASAASLAGFGADSMIRGGFDKSLVRRTAQTIAFVVPGCALLLLSSIDSLTSGQAETLLTFIVGVQSLSVVGFGSSVQDVCISPKYTSVLYGLTSVPAVMFGSFGVYLTGYILDNYHDDWNAVFQTTAVIYFLGAVFYSAFYKSEKLFG